MHQWIGTMPRVRRPILRLAAFPGVGNNVLIRGSIRIPQASIRTAVQLASRAACQSLINSYIASIGSVVNVTDQFGIVFQQITVCDVDTYPSDIVGGARLDAVWTLDVPWVP